MTQLEEISTITAKGQTTIPKSVRKALGVDYGGRIAFQVDDNGVSVRRVDVEQVDPVVEGFLAFLARDMEAHPERISSFPSALAQRIEALVDGSPVDHDDEIHGAVDL